MWVTHGIGVPALREHRHRDDAADVSARWDALVDPAVDPSVAGLPIIVPVVTGRLLVVLADEIGPLLRDLAPGPDLLADGVEAAAF
jgi:hypothetical protein